MLQFARSSQTTLGFLILFFSVFCPKPVFAWPVLAPEEKTPKLEYAFIRPKDVPDEDLEIEFNELAQLGYRFFTGGGSMKNASDAALVMYRDANNPFPIKYEYKVLITFYETTLEKELNQAGKQGFAYCTEFRMSHRSGEEMGVVLEKEVGQPEGQYEYKIKGAKNISNLEKEMNNLGSKGFRYGGIKQSVGFLGGFKFFIVYRRLDPGSREKETSNGSKAPVSEADRFEFRLFTTTSSLALQSKLNELSGQGFYYEDITDSYSSKRPDEMTVVLSRNHRVLRGNREYLVVDHFNYHLRDELASIGQQGYVLVGKRIFHGMKNKGVTIFRREVGGPPREISYLWIHAVNMQQLLEVVNSIGDKGFELFCISSGNQGIRDDFGIRQEGKRLYEGDAIAIFRRITPANLQ